MSGLKGCWRLLACELAERLLLQTCERVVIGGPLDSTVLYTQAGRRLSVSRTTAAVIPILLRTLLLLPGQPGGRAGPARGTRRWIDCYGAARSGLPLGSLRSRRGCASARAIIIIIMPLVVEALGAAATRSRGNSKLPVGSADSESEQEATTTQRCLI